MKSVDGILKVFSKAITQLEVAAEQQEKEIARCENVIAQADVDKSVAAYEKDRATSVANKLRDIVTV